MLSPSVDIIIPDCREKCKSLENNKGQPGYRPPFAFYKQELLSATSAATTSNALLDANSFADAFLNGFEFSL